MRPTKVVITIPLKGWSKHDDVEVVCNVLKGMVKKLLDLSKLTDASPFDTDNISVEMPTGEAPSKG